MVILRESRGLFGDLCLHVVGQRFDICPAVLVFQDAFYRPGSCHSHTLSDCHTGLPQLFLFRWYSDAVISATRLPKPRFGFKHASRHNSVRIHEVRRNPGRILRAAAVQHVCSLLVHRLAREQHSSRVGYGSQNIARF